jgi:spore coat protein A
MSRHPRDGYDGPNRRTVLKAAGAAGLFATSPLTAGLGAAYDGDTPLDIPKWEDPLPVPGVLAPTDTRGQTTEYDVALTEFDQLVLTSSMGMETTVWGYEGSYPGPTIEAQPGRHVEVKYDPSGLPNEHLLSDSVDGRVHGAGPPAPETRIVTHLHGGVVTDEDDGHPTAWVSPDGFTAADFEGIPNSPVRYKRSKEYPNDQEPATIWYHDHALGITRLNVYAGLAGFYIIRDRQENSLPSGMYEIPIVIQDRSFDVDGSLQYPDEFEPEFFGDVPVVNGKTYPVLEVEPRGYRFRFLNGSNNRVFNLKLRNEDAPAADAFADVPLFEQIGTDLGFLDAVAALGPDGDRESMLMGGAERFDVVVDFAGYEGRTFTLTNGAPTPYAGEPFAIDEENFPEVMQFRVTDTVTEEDDTVDLSGFLRSINRRYRPDPVDESGITRYMTLDSRESGSGLDSHFLNDTPFEDADEAGEVATPVLGTSEEWILANTTPDSHPIHLHLVDFEVVGRQNFDADGFEDAREAARDDPDTEEPNVADYLSGRVRGPAPSERGPKDTVLADNGEATVIRPAFTGFAGRYVWHCHILEHEDQEMMLPYEVVKE